MKTKTKHIISYIVLALALVALSISTIVLSVENNNKSKGLHNINNDTYDFYITLGTMPTLYATLNAYQTKNPNTYMWFYRGNTIGKQYSADFIHYFSTQSDDNSNSTIDYWEIRDKVREICTSKPGAHFRLFCDDLRVRFIFDFINAGVDFENLEVTLLSDGTGTYGIYNGLTEESYVAQKQTWANYVQDYVNHRTNKRYNKFIDYNGQAMEFQDYAFYVSTFSNVSYWVQSPDYLKNSTSETLQKERYNMNIVRKDPKAMYNGLDAETKTAYQKVVLANALVDSDT